MLRDLAKQREQTDKHARTVGNAAIVAFLDIFSTRTTFSSLLRRHSEQQGSGRVSPRVIVCAPSALSMWISNKVNLAKCLTRHGFCPETIVYTTDRGEVSVCRMRDATALMHASKLKATRWYVKPVGLSEGAKPPSDKSLTICVHTQERNVALALQGITCVREK